jgi:hypothetical protein
VFKGLPLLGTPIAIGIAWWIWLEGDRETRALRVIGGAARAPAPWRVRVLLLSLAAGSANALIFYAWLAYRLLSGASPQVWKVQAILSNVAGYLILAGLIGASIGKGQGRVLTMVIAIMGLMLWVPVAIL